jgi:hypothetical protein
MEKSECKGTEAGKARVSRAQGGWARVGDQGCRSRNGVGTGCFSKGS